MDAKRTDDSTPHMREAVERETTRKKLQIAPPGPRPQNQTDATGEEHAVEVGLHGTVSVSSWERQFTEPDEESEPTAQSERPLARRVAGTRETAGTGSQEDNILPVALSSEPSPLVRAEAVEPIEVFEGQEVEEQPRKIGFGDISVWTWVVLIGIVLLVIIGLVLGLVLGRGGSSSSPAEVQFITSRPTASPSSSPSQTPSFVPSASPSPSLSPTLSPVPGNWTQVGDFLVGNEEHDLFGWSIAVSGDGSILAVGAPLHNGNDTFNSDRGSVRVYQNVNGVWSPVGVSIYGGNYVDEFNRNTGDEFGSCVALSDDGTVLAVGAPRNRGQVRVFRLTNDEWIPVGNPINGRGGRFGESVTLSADGTVVATGASSSGDALVYELQNGDWNQLGSDISVDAESVSLSHDASVVAMGAFRSNQVQVYRLLNNEWTLIGDPISGSGDFGESVSLSADGRRVAVGAPFSDDSGQRSGSARVYQLENDIWVQLGSTLKGENAGDRFGYSVSLSDAGSVLAIGAFRNDSNGSNSGQVQAFRLTSGDWARIGDPIDGRSEKDGFGTSVALSSDGKVVAGGADQFETDLPGYAMVLRFDEE